MITSLSIHDDAYPFLLKTLSDPPNNLYIKGNVSQDVFKKCLAIVGSREPTRYGLAVLEHIFKDLDKSVTIVSGFMTGIDAYAHELALYHNMSTIAVLPCGINRQYPYRNRNLYSRIIDSKSSFIMSEYPGDMYPFKWTFVKRNRIIAGLSQATLVVEASLNSGSLLTASYATKYKRNLLVVPGDIFSPKSCGCNYLLNKGAWAINSGKDINSILTKLKLSI